MRKILLLFLVVFISCLLFFGVFYYGVFLKKRNMNLTKSFFNIVLIGAAGSGKGTQADFIKSELNLLPISAGEVMRQYRKDPDAKYSKIITEYIDRGQLVPVDITNEIIGDYVDKHVFCKGCKYKGIIFDGYPRQMEQLIFLDDFLDERENKIDAVVYINVPMESLVDRLSGRFSCSTCGELYHKTTKPTKVEGMCDKCGGHLFVVRRDDQDKDAIRARFKIFEESTKIVLNEYKERDIVITVDGTNTPKEVAEEILKKLNEIKKNK